MPRRVTKYLCDYRCGHKAMNKKGDMEAHEKTCWKNPELKTCRSCKHYSFHYGDPEMDDCRMDECGNKEAGETLEICIADQERSHKEKFDIKIKEWEEEKKGILGFLMGEKPVYYSLEWFAPVINCPFWEIKK